MEKLAFTNSLVTRQTRMPMTMKQKRNNVKATIEVLFFCCANDVGDLNNICL